MFIAGYRRLSDCLLLNTTNGLMKLCPYSSNIVRITYTLREEFSTRSSLMATGVSSHVEWDVSDNNVEIILSTRELRIKIDKITGAFTYTDAQDNLLVKEPSQGGKQLVPVDVMRSVFDETTEIRTGQGADGVRIRADNVNRIIDRKAYQTRLAFEWAENEALYGLGSHEEGMLNLRGQHQYLYQQNMKAVVPILLSSRGYGIVLDNYSLMIFHDDAFGSYWWSDVAEELDYYFVYGPEFDQIVGGIRRLTGEAPMLPRWAFGYIQSKERYLSQEELIDTVKEYRKRKLPLDCIVLDWKSWVGELWGQKTLDPERFPNPKEMMDQIHDMNARLMVSIWPIMNPEADNCKEMKEQGYLLGNQANYDAFQEGARQLYWKQTNEGLFVHGIDAWWCDCTEPFESDWKGEVKPGPEERMLINTEEAKLYLDPAYINAYSLLHSKGIYEGQRSVTELKRVVNLTRSAYAGQHRYGTITWSGDIAANWETLRKQIADGLNFCATGSPYWTLDIGAFFVHNKPELWFWNGDYNSGCDDLGYRELYLRWFQLGAFLPMFRSHGTDTPREIWRFGQPGEAIYDSLVTFLHLRYRLMPYIYSLAGRVAQESYTMMRLLAFDFRQDPRIHEVKDQFMFGPAFLVCPVTTPMYYEKDSSELSDVPKKRSVYFPAGSRWYDFWTGEVWEGGQTEMMDAPLEHLPLFIKEGSIVPMGPIVQHTDENPEAPLEIRIYPGADGLFVLYEDQGDGYDYERGAYSLIEFSWKDKLRKLSIGSRQGTYPGMSKSREFRIILVDSERGAGLHEQEHGFITLRYEGLELEWTA